MKTLQGKENWGSADTKPHTDNETKEESMSETNGTAAFDPRKARAALALLAQDMAGSGDFPENHGAAIKQLAEVVHSLCGELDALKQQVCAVMEQKGLDTRRLRKLADSFAAVAYETAGWNPVPLADFLPEGPEHLHTGDDGPCWGADCFTAVTKDPVDCPRCGGLDGTHTLRGCGSAQGPVDAEPAEVQ